MAYNKAFTLVELIVWVTISMLLMTSVWVLVSGGMQNILKQQKIMQKNSLLTTSVSDFYNGFYNITLSWGYIHNNSSGALFKINQNIQKWGFWYFWIISQDDQYCPTDSDLPRLDYLTWKTFIPYEEIDEDIMDTYSETTFQEVSTGSIIYKVDTLNHKIYEDDILIIWWEVFWHEFINWADWIDIRLNSPTWIVLAEWWFFFSDTLNHRVLFYENWKISLILDKNDGLSEPTWLAYDNLKNTLYVANSWKWEVLKYSSENISTNPKLEINFSPNQDINNITRFTLDFWEDIFTPTNTWSVTFSNEITHDEDFSRVENWVFEYYFADYRQSNQGTPPFIFSTNCSSGFAYNVMDNQPIKDQVICDFEGSNTGSTFIHFWNIENDFEKNENYKITLDNISPIFSTPKNHLIEMELFDISTSLYKEKFKYFTQWDEEVKNGENMTLHVFVNDLQYPTGLEIIWWNIKINDFIVRKEYLYNLTDWSRLENKNLNDFTAENFTQFDYSLLTDTILENPISEISVNYDTVNKYFSTNIKYYQFINCYNIDEKVEKTLLFSKSID
jgi:type II secretory pathway pseudopilin PulG